MAGAKLSEFDLKDPQIDTYAVKEAVLPFARFPGVDTILGPEMRSTGEVMGSDPNFHLAFLKAQMGAGTSLPRPEDGKVFLSIKPEDKGPMLAELAQTLHSLGFPILATRGTAAFLAEHDVPAEIVNKVYEGRPNVVDQMKDGLVSLVLNTTEGAQAVEDSRDIRAVALYDKIPYFTTLAASHAAALAIKARDEGDIVVRALQG